MRTDFYRDCAKTNREDTKGSIRPHGHVLIGVMILLALSAVIAASTLELGVAGMKTSYAFKKQSERYYNLERSLNLAVAWLRSNSANMIFPFERKNFYSLFEKGDPEPGSNDGVLLSIPTQVKVKKTSLSVLLTNSSALGTSYFPKGSFDPVKEFGKVDFAGADVRITMLNAYPNESGKDYGPPPAALPETDFVPVYRIDVLNPSNRGIHLSAVVTASLSFKGIPGFFGSKSLKTGRTCDGYNSSEGSYSKKTRKAGCEAASLGNLEVRRRRIIYGSAKALKKLKAETKGYGLICADFEPGCLNRGTACSGKSCGITPIAAFKKWDEYCPKAGNSLNVKKKTVLSIKKDRPEDRCWKKVKISKRGVLILTSSKYPYYFRELEVSYRGQIIFSPPPDETISLNFEKVKGATVRGRNFVNPARPAQVLINYHGKKDLKIVTDKELKAVITAPAAKVKMSGNRDFFGALRARTFETWGRGYLHYDVSEGSGSFSDIKYRVREISNVSG